MRKAVYEHVETLNGQFITPLPLSEVKAIAKSIANWTFKHFTPSKFRESQAKKGAKGGKAGSLEDKVKAGAIGGSVGGAISKGGGRPDKKALLPQVLEMKAKGCTNRNISEMLGISSGSVSNWLRSLKS